MSAPVDRALAELRAELASADALPGDYVLIGTAVMYLHGIAVEVGDLDLFVRPPLYRALRRRGWAEAWVVDEDPPLLERECAGLTANAWERWDERHLAGDVVERAFATARTVVPGVGYAWPCMDLGMLREWKALIRRPKDRLHVAAIRRAPGGRGVLAAGELVNKLRWEPTAPAT